MNAQEEVHRKRTHQDHLSLSAYQNESQRCTLSSLGGTIHVNGPLNHSQVTKQQQSYRNKLCGPSYRNWQYTTCERVECPSMADLNFCFGELVAFDGLPTA